ncbi:hypothetical protein K503DRAFT_569511 [Rhizopogon vinicolor AM-OR11-026]|uniref:Uncharacterized protein n=1 Tax=Rhizopogon vinicolor AM-OR11-026 TaxID=1314800 RepID=A0A1B7MJV7_9AGAM|nr:hypothetical protein K503DRAFT_569511 [Rhizopogon vinicolor AM-OR11-026]
MFYSRKLSLSPVVISLAPAIFHTTAVAVHHDLSFSSASALRPCSTTTRELRV